MATRILSSDLLICDVIVPLAEYPQLQPLIEQYNAEHPGHPIALGSKSPLNAGEFLRWKDAVGDAGKYMAGGSAANTLSALKQLMGDSVHIDFIAAYGTDKAGQVVAESLAQDGFHLWPQATAFADVQTAMSFVLVNAQGQRSIVGFAGNSREKILAGGNAIPDAYDILFLPGSLWQKYGQAFAQSLSASCVKQKKRLWLSLPTHSQSGRQYNDAVRSLVPQAEVVLANADELMRMLAAPNSIAALKHLQSLMSQGQVAFITNGMYGAYVVTRGHVEIIDAEDVPVKNTLGAGDAAFAGFLYGLLTDAADVARAGHIAMQLAAVALQTDSARLTEIPRIFS